MSLLREFIKEELSLISEKYVALSTEDQIMDSAEQLFSMIKSNTSLKDKILTKDESGRWLHTQENKLDFFKNFFKIEFKTKQEHKIVKVDVSFFMDNPDEEDPSEGLHKVISEEKSEISLNYEIVSKQSLGEFKRLIYHELIHSQDPLVRNRELKKSYTDNQIDKYPEEFWNNKLSEEEKSKVRRDSYLNSTYEFSAFIGELVFDIKSRAKGDPKKIGLLKDLMFLLMKNASGERMSEEEIKISMTLEDEGVFTDFDDYYSFADSFKNKAKFWLNNPKHKKKLRKYLGQGIFDASESSRKAKEESNPRSSKQKEKKQQSDSNNSALTWFKKLFSKFI
jgi:hypothetical protein